MNAIDHYFGISESGSSLQTEILAGITTFLTMAYILFVNPDILGDAGMPKDSVFVATCLAAALASLIMGLYANYPIACAPGMGLNAYFAYTIVKGMGFTWQAALGAVFISGCLFMIVTLLRVREMIVKGIPDSIRAAITGGIALFLAIIALKAAGIIVGNPVTLVTLADLHKPSVVLAAIGFFVIVALDFLRVRGAILIGILCVTVLSFFFGGNQFHGIVSAPPSIDATLFQLDIRGALSGGILHVVLVLFLIELFDATGALMSIASRAGLLTEGNMHRLNKALLADSTAIVAGAMLGTSSTTAYIESASGVLSGGRTGVTAITVAILFLASLFFAPLASVVPGYATAPALFYVSCLMLGEFARLPWDDATEAVPAALTALMMPLTYSIANGVAFGFISYAGLKLFTGRARQVKAIVWIIAAIFLFRYAYFGSE